MRPLMIQGTASGVGKSLITTAFCRILVRRGLRVLPFKAQNMSNNAAVAHDGGEIGRAQALQAQAARVEPHVRMNPVLLKPLSDRTCDVIVLGRSQPDLRETPWHDRKDVLWPYVTEALDSLRADADVVVIEGAGSPAETNLRSSDIVNMAVAHYADAAVLLVADIDRGGAFAALFGTWSLLDSPDRARIRGFLLNRFRGDPRLLAPAPAELCARTGVPTLGVVPYIRHDLPDEDAFIMRQRSGGGPTIAAIRFPHIANFDDLDPLAAEPGITVRWTVDPEDVRTAAAIILPGTRNTVSDLQWLWRSGLAAAIRARAAQGVQIVGLCGGYQMLGDRVCDPEAIEGGGAVAGLQLISGETTLAPAKQTRQTCAQVMRLPFPGELHEPQLVHGYEIHHGETSSSDGWIIGDTAGLGAARGSVWGCYLHGLFGNDWFRKRWLESFDCNSADTHWGEHVERELDRVADMVGNAVDIDQILQLIDARS
jgi:adenosylcobyric acid synthase